MLAMMTLFWPFTSKPVDTSPKARSADPMNAAAPGILRAYEDLPGPRGLPFFGNALQLDVPRLHQQYERWSREFGPLFKLKLPGRRVLVVADHEMVAAVLRDRPDGFARSSKIGEIWTELGLPQGVFGANGDVWKRQRRMVMAGFDPAHVKRYYPSMVAVSQRLSARWRSAALAGQVVDVQPELMRYTVDTIAGLAFGAHVDTLSSDGDVIQQHLDQIFPALFQHDVIRPQTQRQVAVDTVPWLPVCGRILVTPLRSLAALRRRDEIVSDRLVAAGNSLPNRDLAVTLKSGKRQDRCGRNPNAIHLLHEVRRHTPNPR